MPKSGTASPSVWNTRGHAQGLGGDLVRETGLKRAAQIARAANNHFLLLTLLVVTTSPGALELWSVFLASAVST